MVCGDKQALRSIKSELSDKGYCHKPILMFATRQLNDNVNLTWLTILPLIIPLAITIALDLVVTWWTYPLFRLFVNAKSDDANVKFFPRNDVGLALDHAISEKITHDNQLCVDPSPVSDHSLTTSDTVSMGGCLGNVEPHRLRVYSLNIDSAKVKIGNRGRALTAPPEYLSSLSHEIERIHTNSHGSIS